MSNNLPNFGGKMISEPEVTIVLPAYNEVKRISETIKQVKEYFEQRQVSYEVIVAADGDDGTRELVAEMAKSDPHLSVIGNVERRGKGFGIRQAVMLARGQIIGFSDADNKTPIQEFDKIEPLLHTHEVVIGSRGLEQSRIVRYQPLYRRLGSKGFRIFMWSITGLRQINDTQCGFKFFQRHAAKNLFAHQKIDGYMFDVEILFLAQKWGYGIAEVPVCWSDDGDSRLVLFRGNVRNFIDVVKIRLKAAGQPKIVPVVSEVKITEK
jgi:dolichyl-phosphate beta-glucosyltransferase